MSGKKGMSSPRYPQAMKDTIKQMVSNGKTQQEIAEHFGLKDRFVVHHLLKRERRKEEAAERTLGTPVVKRVSRWAAKRLTVSAQSRMK